MWLLCSILVIKSAQCATACNFQGYDGGYFKNNHCYCLNKFEFSDLVSKKTQGTFKSKEVDKPEEL